LPEFPGGRAIEWITLCGISQRIPYRLDYIFLFTIIIVICCDFQDFFNRENSMLLNSSVEQQEGLRCGISPQCRFYPLRKMIRSHQNESVLKDRRRRPEGGEWEPIKIPHWNLAYVPKSTINCSLLTRSRPSSYRPAIGLRNWAGNYNKDTESY
jgi:hypothetical protein